MLVLNKMQRTYSAISPDCCAGYYGNCPQDPADLTVLRMIGIKFVIFGRTMLVIHSTRVCVLSFLTLCNPIDYSQWGPSVHGIFQARILQCIAISSSRGSSQPREQSHVSCTEPPGKPNSQHIHPEFWSKAMLISIDNYSHERENTSCLFWGPQFNSVQFTHSVVCDSLRPHESQHARPPCPSPTPGVHPNSCLSSQ